MVSISATEHQFDFDSSWAESFEMKRRLGNAQEARMAKLSLAMMTVVLLIGLTVSANASTLTGVSGLPNLTKGYSPIETVGCACGPRGCACRRRVWRCWWHRGRRVCGWRW